jgi:hypothetical protein
LSNLGASTSWKPQGLSRPVIGLLYLTFYCGFLRNIDYVSYTNKYHRKSFINARINKQQEPGSFLRIVVIFRKPQATAQRAQKV